jgi:hypothetical protein
MKTSKLNLFALLFFCILKLSAQTDFRPGFIISDQDTIKGWIDYRGDFRNSRKCIFKKDQTSEPKEYSPGEIKGYRFNDSKYYESKKVFLGDQETPLFLEFLVDGKANLYFSRDEDNTPHFFIEKSNGDFFELTNAEELIKQSGRTYTHEKKEYIGILKIAFSDCPQLFPLINQASLEIKPLINLTKKYHDYVCDSIQCIIYEKQVSKVKFSFAPFVSMNASALAFQNPGYEYEDVSFKTAVYPSLGIKMNTSLPRANEKISFQASEEVSKSNLYATGYYAGNTKYEKVSFHPVTLKTRAGFRYTFPKGKIRPTFTMGGHLIAFLDKEGQRVQDYTENNQVYTITKQDDVLPNFNLGYNLELALNYYKTSSRISFIGIGYDASTGPNRSFAMRVYRKNWELPLNTLIKTVNINAGFYF